MALRAYPWITTRWRHKPEGTQSPREAITPAIPGFAKAQNVLAALREGRDAARGFGTPTHPGPRVATFGANPWLVCTTPAGVGPEIHADAPGPTGSHFGDNPWLVCTTPAGVDPELGRRGSPTRQNLPDSPNIFESDANKFAPICANVPPGTITVPRSFSAVNVHLVFSTKDRRPFLGERTFRLEVHGFLGAVSNQLGCQTWAIGGVSDHVHILCSLGKTTSQSDYVKELKRVSSLWIKDRQPDLANFAWQGGYGIFSVDGRGVEAVRHYIENQERHHHAISFQEEFRDLFREHGMECEERYIWE